MCLGCMSFTRLLHRAHLKWSSEDAFNKLINAIKLKLINPIKTSYKLSPLRLAGCGSVSLSGHLRDQIRSRALLTSCVN